MFWYAGCIRQSTTRVSQTSSPFCAVEGEHELVEAGVDDCAFVDARFRLVMDTRGMIRSRASSGSGPTQSSLTQWPAMAFRCTATRTTPSQDRRVLPGSVAPRTPAASENLIHLRKGCFCFRHHLAQEVGVPDNRVYRDLGIRPRGR